MFLRLNMREAKMLVCLANGDAIENEAHTLKRLQGLGLVNRDFQGNPADPVTPNGLDWIRNNPTPSGR